MYINSDQIHEENRLMFAAQNNPEDFGMIYQKYAHPIFLYCRKRVNTNEEAEDLSSDIFELAFAKRHQYRGGMVSAWLFAIAHNVVVSYYRKRIPVTFSMDDWDIPDEHQNILANLEVLENQEMLAEVLMTLTDSQRNLLSMALEQHLTSHQIAACLQISPITVRTRLHRIMKGLRDQFVGANAQVA